MIGLRMADDLSEDVEPSMSNTATIYSELRAADYHFSIRYNCENS